MLNPDRAYTITGDKGLSFDDAFFIFSGAENPWALDSGVNTGSWYLKTDGAFYKKTGAGTAESDWTLQEMGSGSSTLSVSSTAVSATAPSTGVFILTHSSGTLTISLPASPATGQHVHVKLRSAGDAVLAGNGHLIEGESSLPMQIFNMSLHLVYSGSEWVIL